MGNMTDLVARLREAIDETERIARAATPGPWSWAHRVGPYKFGLVSGEQMVLPSAVPDIYPQREDAAHIARHDPAAVLRRCAADRKILDLHVPDDLRYNVTSCSVCISDRDGYEELWQADQWPCPTLLALAEAYGVEA